MSIHHSPHKCYYSSIRMQFEYLNIFKHSLQVGRFKAHGPGSGESGAASVARIVSAVEGASLARSASINRPPSSEASAVAFPAADAFPMPGSGTIGSVAPASPGTLRNRNLCGLQIRIASC